jgi:RNA recognition motif-containing protein
VGTVESIHLVKDSDSGTLRGCGYVRMASEEEAREAVNLLNGAMLGDRLITVKMCVKKNDIKARPSDRSHEGGKAHTGREIKGESDGNKHRKY